MVIKIECDRRIRKLNIEFGDSEDDCEIIYDEEVEDTGNTPKSKKTHRHKESRPSEPKGALLNLEEDYTTDVSSISQEVIEKPQIEDKERSPQVAQEMQNLEF